MTVQNYDTTGHPLWNDNCESEEEIFNHCFNCPTDTIYESDDYYCAEPKKFDIKEKMIVCPVCAFELGFQKLCLEIKNIHTDSFYIKKVASQILDLKGGIEFFEEARNFIENYKYIAPNCLYLHGICNELSEIYKTILQYHNENEII